MAQSARRTVARIGKKLQPEKLTPLVDRLKCRLRHVDLTAHFEVRQRLLEFLYDVFDDLGIFRDVLALHDAVAARDGTAQHPVFIAQGKRKSVDLFFDDEHRIFHARLYIVHESFYLLAREYILQGKHRHVVAHERACRALRRTADLLRRRVFRDKLRIFPFQRLEPQHKLIVFIITDFRIVVVVVTHIVVTYRAPQLCKLFFDFLNIHTNLRLSR